VHTSVWGMHISRMSLKDKTYTALLATVFSEIGSKTQRRGKLTHRPHRFQRNPITTSAGRDQEPVSTALFQARVILGTCFPCRGQYVCVPILIRVASSRPITTPMAYLSSAE